MKCGASVSVKVSCNQDEMRTVETSNNKHVLEGCRSDDCRKFLHLQLPPCQDLAISQEYNFTVCCNFVHQVSKFWSAMLKVMKFSILFPNFIESVDEEISVFPNISKALPDYALITQSEDSRRNFNSFFPLCQFMENKRSWNSDLVICSEEHLQTKDWHIFLQLQPIWNPL